MVGLDLVGGAASLVTTLGFVRHRTWAWPLSLVANLLNGWLYARTGFMALVLLQASYALMACVGWYRWCYGGVGRAPLPLSYPSWKVVVATGGAWVLGTLWLGHVVHDPLWQGLEGGVAWGSVLAQWWVCQRYVTHWCLWWVVDGLSAWLFATHGLTWHVVLMGLYVLMGVWGYLRWQRLYCEQLRGVRCPT